MGKRANYGFEKRQKEIKRQQKKEAKAEKKRLKKETASAGESPDVLDGTDDAVERPGDAAVEPEPTADGSARG